jgi:hypothetical protein
MSQIDCERCNFLAPMRWLHASDHLSRPDHVDRCAERSLMRPKRTPRCTFEMHIARSRPRLPADMQVASC